MVVVVGTCSHVDSGSIVCSVFIVNCMGEKFNPEMKFTVYFEIFGKKLKTTVDATSEEDAKYKVMGAIRWHKVVPERLGDGDMLNHLKDIFGMK